MCPSWTYHSENLRRFIRAWGIGSEGNLYELLTGVLPVAQVWRSWQQDDETDSWGLSCLVDTQVGARVPAVVVLPSATRDCLIDQIDVIAYPQSSLTDAAIAQQFVAVYTVSATYAPIPDFAHILVGPQPGLLNSSSFALPQTIIFGGYNTVLPPPSTFASAVYFLDSYFSPGDSTLWPAAMCNVSLGSPPCPVDGGQIPTGVITLGSQAAFFIARQTRIWGHQNPPMRVPSGSAMAIQLGVIPSVRYVLLVVFQYREQSSEEI